MRSCLRIQGENAFDNMVGSGLVRGIEVARLGCRLERAHDHSGRVRPQMEELTIQKGRLRQSVLKSLKSENCCCVIKRPGGPAWRGLQSSGLFVESRKGQEGMTPRILRLGFHLGGRDAGRLDSLQFPDQPMRPKDRCCQETMRMREWLRLSTRDHDWHAMRRNRPRLSLQLPGVADRKPAATCAPRQIPSCRPA